MEQNLKKFKDEQKPKTIIHGSDSSLFGNISEEIARKQQSVNLKVDEKLVDQKQKLEGVDESIIQLNDSISRFREEERQKSNERFQKVQEELRRNNEKFQKAHEEMRRNSQTL